MFPFLSRFSVRLSVAVMLFMTPLATAWMIGDLSSRGFARHELDTAFGPYPVSHLTSVLFGTISIMLFVGSAALVIVALAQRRLQKRWIPTGILLLFFGVMLGYVWRVVTAGVIGANIGAGLMIILGGPFLLLYLAVTLVIALMTRRSLRRSA